MIVQCRCVESFAGDAFGTGQYEKFSEGGVYALPSVFISENATKFELLNKIETKPLRQALEVKGNNSTRQRTSNTRRAKAKSQNH